MNDFSPKRYGETELFAVDYADRLAPGVTITSATWAIVPISGQDPLAAAMIQGDAIVSGSVVSQMITAGVPGVCYAPACYAMTSDDQVLMLPEYGQGYLEITL